MGNVPYFDSLRPYTGAQRNAILGAVVGLVVLTAAGLMFANVTLVEIPSVVFACNVGMGLVSAFTALLLFQHATTAQAHAYNVLGAAFLFVCIVQFAFPLIFPGAMLVDEQIVGGLQSSAALYWSYNILWILALLAGVRMLAAERAGRANGVGLLPAALAAFLVAGGLILWVVVLADSLPAFFDFSVSPPEIQAIAQVCAVVAAALALVVVAVCAERAVRGSRLHLWLLLTAFAFVMQTLPALGGGTRYGFAWYLRRVGGLLSASALLVGLIAVLSRLGRQLAMNAREDSLTGCLSRSGLYEQLDFRFAARPGHVPELVAVWIDIDNFKGINDRVGQAAGDEVLVEVANRLAAVLRPEDLLARIGGDEFCVVIDPVGSGDDPAGAVPADLDALGRRLLDSLSEPIEVGDTTTLVTAAVGLAASSPATHTEDLLDSANLAMCAAKAAGPNRIISYDPAMTDRAAADAVLHHEISLGLRRDEYLYHYQPILSLADGSLWGFEALARWQQGEEVRAAIEFVPSAEQSGQVLAIGRRLLEGLPDALAALTEAHGSGIKLTVNLSGAELSTPAILDLLTGPTHRDLLPRLVIEVVETQAVGPGSPALDALDRLRGHGAQVAIDDFGVGYSNFGALEELRPNVIKIDRSLAVRAAQGETRGVAVARAVIALAQSFGATVIAEGTEAESHKAALRSLGVQLAQGYLLGSPAPLADAVAKGGQRSGMSLT